MIRAVPFKSVGGRRNGRFFEGGEGPNSELFFPIRLHIISGRRGGGAEFLITFRSSPPLTTLLNGKLFLDQRTRYNMSNDSY